MDRLAVYPVRLPYHIKAALPEVAKKYGMTAPELVRTIIGLIVAGQVELTLVQNEEVIVLDVTVPDVAVSNEIAILDDAVIECVSKYFGLTPEDIKGEKRSRRFSIPRQIAIYLLREMARASFVQIGNALGKRNHTTIMYGYRRAIQLIKENENIRLDVMSIKEIVSAERDGASGPLSLTD